jgi:hypothetical protein
MSHEYELAVTDSALLAEELIADVDAATAAHHRAAKEAAAAAEEGKIDG